MKTEEIKRTSDKKGISLIVLVITIIVIIILAVAVILSIANNNPIENAKEARFKSDVRTMQEELEMLKASNYAKNNGASCNDPETGNQPAIGDLNSATNYQEKFTISNGELKYLSSKLTVTEQNWAKEIGVSSNAYLLGSDPNDGVTISNDGVLTTNWYDTGSDTTTVPDMVSKDVEIPVGVTSIGNGAFYNCSSLSSITIPSTVTSIGNSSFQKCSSLISITIPSSVKDIGNMAFNGCTSLKSIIIEGEPRFVAQLIENIWGVEDTSIVSGTGLKAS